MVGNIDSGKDKQQSVVSGQMIHAFQSCSQKHAYNMIRRYFGLERAAGGKQV